MKKIIALLMAVLMTVGMLAACSNTPVENNPPADETKGQVDAPETPDTPAEKEKVTLKVWADQGELELIEKLCNEFAAAHPEKECTFEYGAVGAADGSLTKASLCMNVKWRKVWKDLLSLANRINEAATVKLTIVK